MFCSNKASVALGQRPCNLSCHCKHCDVTVDWITRCSSQYVMAERKEEVVEQEGVSELKLFLDKTLSYFWIAIILFGWFSNHFAVKESIRAQLDGEVRERLYTCSANCFSGNSDL